MEAWLLFIIGILLCVLELFSSTGFFLLILGLGVLLVGALTFFGVITSWVVQATVFSIVSLGIWFLFGDWLQRLLRSGEKPYGGLLGQVAVARETIAPGHKGAGEMWGAPWRLENIGSSIIQSGDECEVVSSDGLVLRVQRKGS
jgi:membrane protein implicated in regulation of membrane protease activity